MAIWGIDADGNIHENISALLECFVIDGDEFSIKLFSNCEIAALAPGNVKIQAQLNVGFQGELLGLDVNVNVTPKSILLFSSSFAVEMQNWQTELWMSLSGIRNQAFYRATMSGLLPSGTIMEVIPSRDNNEVCRNRVPINGANVACYFHSVEAQTIFVIKNPLQSLINARVSIQQVSEIDQSTVSHFVEQAIPIILDLPISEFLFANEIGVNSTHYFQFKYDVNRPAPAQPVRVVLKYNRSTLLDVSWGNGICTSQMMEILENQTSCIVPASVNNNLVIKIMSNENTSAENSAAVEGGNQYELHIETVL